MSNLVVRHPDMWRNQGRYRTRPDGSLYPKEQARLKEQMNIGAGEDASTDAKEVSPCQASPAPSTLEVTP